jgi:hypothetical protein
MVWSCWYTTKNYGRVLSNVISPIMVHFNNVSLKIPNIFIARFTDATSLSVTYDHWRMFSSLADWRRTIYTSQNQPCRPTNFTLQTSRIPTGTGLQYQLSWSKVLLSYSSIILDVGTWWRWVVSFTTQPLYSRGRESTRYPLDRNLSRHQGRSRCCEVDKYWLPLPGIKPRPPSLVRRYTDWGSWLLISVLVTD